MRLGSDSMVLLSSDVSTPTRSSACVAMDCTSVAAAMVPHGPPHGPHPMKQRGDPAGGNTVPGGVSAAPSSWHHHKHEQLMLLEKQKTKGEWHGELSVLLSSWQMIVQCMVFVYVVPPPLNQLVRQYVL